MDYHELNSRLDQMILDYMDFHERMKEKTDEFKDEGFVEPDVYMPMILEIEKKFRDFVHSLS